ncbi:hypothetical protein [Vogesella oryzae]|uniref:hypothetical protein n=1 Tax=Vogesella oryzae TaxID=1735285 RepID=UPI001581852E|nr:hypothetical protein [Vogesella oryzae]
MESSAPQLEPATCHINGKAIHGIPGVKLDYQALEIHLHGRERIKLYTFKAVMLPNERNRKGTDRYSFIGPKLGLYHDTIDMRDGPYVNHYIDQLDISITYLSNTEASFNIKGRCDLARSYFDPYYFKEVPSGDWTFEVSFVYKFKQV